MLRMPTDTYLWSSKQNLLENYWVYPPPQKTNKQRNQKQTQNPLQFDKLTQSKQDCDRHVQRKNGN